MCEDVFLDHNQQTAFALTMFLGRVETKRKKEEKYESEERGRERAKGERTKRKLKMRRIRPRFYTFLLWEE